MIRFIYLTVFLLCIFLQGFSQQRNTPITCDIPNYTLIISNDTDKILDNIFISKPRKGSISDGSTRLFFSVRNIGDTRFKKYSLSIYHNSKKVFRTKLPDLKKGEEFQFAFNLKEKNVKLSDLKLKFQKKKIYRILQYTEK